MTSYAHLAWMDIIKFIDSTDVYKITMGAPFAKRPGILAESGLIIRPGTILHPNVGGYLTEQINHKMPRVGLSDEGRDHLLSLPFIPESYVDFLANFQYDPSQITIDDSRSVLSVLARGPHYQTTHWEIPILRLIATLHNLLTYPSGPPNEEWEEDTLEMAEFIKMHALTTVDFATRRSIPWIHHRMLEIMFENAGETFLGSSNVHEVAMHNLKVPDNQKRSFGTTAHEYDQRNAALYGYRDASAMTLKEWMDFYDGSLGVVLPDTYGIETFLKGFSLMYARAYTGPRHDSGDPYWFATRFVEHYLELGLSPEEIATKSIVFSNSLKVDEGLLRLRDHCEELGIGCSFGIGNGLVAKAGYPQLGIVFKLLAIKHNNWGWIPTVKVPDDLGKATGSLDEIAISLLHTGRAKSLAEAMEIIEKR